MPKISIAIPAYNAERTLERTVQSVLRQTLREIEVIIVNNGSSDRTGEIARQIAAGDSRVQVWDVYPNIGGYGARLYAWRRAKGEFLATVDADDVVEPDMYCSMLGFAKQHDLDVVECGWCNGIKTPIPDGDEIELCLTRGEVIEKIVYPTFIAIGKSAYVWNKIYRNQYDFSTWLEGDFGSYEDLIHNLQLFKAVCRYGKMANRFYHYMPNAQSVTRKFSLTRLRQFDIVAKAKRTLVQNYGVKQDDEIIDRWILNDATNAVIAIALYQTDASKRECINRLLDIDAVKMAIKNKSIGIGTKLMLMLAERLPSGWMVVSIQFARAVLRRAPV